MQADTSIQTQLEAAFNKAAINIHKCYNPAYLTYNISYPILDKIKDHFDGIENISQTDLIPMIRNYVHCARGSGENFRSSDDYTIPVHQIEQYLKAVYNYHAGNRKVAVGIFCEAHVLTMGAILGHFGILSRETGIFSTNSDPAGRLIKSHALLEVWNEEKNRWELHDPTLDIAYARHDPIAGKDIPISAFEFVSTGSESIVCLQGKTYSWPRNNQSPYSEKQKFYYFKYYASQFTGCIISRFRSYNPCIIINLEKVDMKKRFPGMGNRNLLEHLNTVHYNGFNPPVAQGWYKGSYITLPPIQTGFEFDKFYPEIARELGYFEAAQ